MKAIKLLVFTVCMLIALPHYSYAFSIHKPPVNAGGLQNLSAREFVKLSASDFGELTGKKMTFGDKLMFAVTKVRMKRALKKDPDLRVMDYLASNNRGSTLNIIKWVVIGFLVLMLVVLAVAGGKFN